METPNVTVLLQYSLIVCSDVFLRERGSWPWVIKKGWSCLCLVWVCLCQSLFSKVAYISRALILVSTLPWYNYSCRNHINFHSNAISELAGSTPAVISKAICSVLKLRGGLIRLAAPCSPYACSNDTKSLFTCHMLTPAGSPIICTTLHFLLKQ